MTSPLLEQGISAALSGRRDEARALLAQVVEADEHDEQAWLWLAGLVDDPEDVRTCLENVLHLNPSNAKAQQGLAWVEQQHGKRPAIEPEAVIDAPPVPAVGVAPATPPPAPLPDPSPILEITALPLPDDPCPYCGAATAQDHKRCPSCRHDLMVRPASREKRSKALTTLGWLWGIQGIFYLLATGLALYMLITLQRTGSFYGVSVAQLRRANISIAELQARTLVGLVYALIDLSIASGLLRRKRWAWIICAGLQALWLIVLLCLVFSLTAIMKYLAIASGGLIRPGILSTIFLIIVLLLFFAPLIVNLVLIIFSYGDVFVPMERLRPRVGVAKPTQHYNNGLDYKNRGMWYMAAQEWVAAVRHAPHEPDFLHALGLAFAQLKQYDKARVTLDFAMQLVPDSQQLKESRALVERMEKGAGKW